MLQHFSVNPVSHSLYQRILYNNIVQYITLWKERKNIFASYLWAVQSHQMKIRRNPKFHLVVFVKVCFCLTIFSDCFLFVLRLTFRHNNVRPQVMHRSAKFQTPPKSVYLLWSCEGLWRGLSFVFSRSDCHLTI